MQIHQRQVQMSSIAVAATALPLLPLFLAPLVIRVRNSLYRNRASSKLRMAFLHPDLGIGGAERLVVDAALSLQRRGHTVSIITAHHDRSRCFEETRDGTLVVHVAGSRVPRHLFGKLHIVCATLRALLGAMYLLLCEPGVDAVFVDQVPAPVPLLRACGVPVLFYCHFPDKLLAVGGAGGHDKPSGSMAKRLLRHIYRLPFDMLEEVCTGCSSRVLVNSKYTASVYHAHFHVLRAVRSLTGALPPSVLHPAIDLARNLPTPPPEASTTLQLVSINRFERKKALELAIEALGMLRDRRTSETSEAEPSNPPCAYRLVLAGGYDPRLRENVEYHNELSMRIEQKGLSEEVELRRNVSEDERRALFASAGAVVYTPSFEHFGIVPLEAMAAARPVVAVGLGGPCESIVSGESGWLCEPTAESFAAAFEEAARLHARGQLELRGLAARERVKAHFSLDVFGERLEKHLEQIAGVDRR